MKKIFLQKVGIFAVTFITLGILVWSMFIPESNKWWNTYLIALACGVIYFLVRFMRNRWEDDYGSVLGKMTIVGILVSVFGPTVQLLGLQFTGANLLDNSSTSSLPCTSSISWMFFLMLCGLIDAYISSRGENNKLVNLTILFACSWLVFIQIGFLDEILGIFGYEPAMWLDTVFSVVYPITFFGTFILIVCCIIRGIIKKD